ncbi:hypothetical protein BDR07DRAFT_1495252 [Suillus spraguei]|nr:hypothetical protein BDR07DRAFT_1495252 [Suillus spraguei]
MSQYTSKQRAEDELASLKSTKYSRHYLNSDATYSTDEQENIPAFSLNEPEQWLLQHIEHLQVTSRYLEQLRVEDKEQQTRMKDDVKCKRRLLERIERNVHHNSGNLDDVEKVVQQLQLEIKAQKHKFSVWKIRTGRGNVGRRQWSFVHISNPN